MELLTITGPEPRYECLETANKSCVRRIHTLIHLTGKFRLGFVEGVNG